MARFLNTLSVRLVLVLLLVHAVLLPVLFYGLFVVVEQGQKEMFIDHTRIYGRILADVFESSGALDSQEQTIDLLDSAILGGNAVYAVLQRGDETFMSSLMDATELASFAEDFDFGEHGDQAYYLSVPTQGGGDPAILRLGFDETPTSSQIELIRDRVIGILAGYLVVSLVLVLILGIRLTRPLQGLRRDSRRVASGEYTRQLSAKSGLLEISELAADLETMRGSLVGINERLQREINERRAAEKQGAVLEDQLRHSQRLESIGTLAGGVAHEVNNILLPIIIYTDIVLEDLPGDSAVRDYLQRIRRLADRAKGLSEQILTFSRQGGERHLQLAEIAPVVEEAVTLVRALVPATIDIRTNIDRDCGKIRCNQTQLQQLVVNICSNAYKAVAKEGSYIGVDLESVLVGRALAEKHPQLILGRYVRLSVSDDGIGMDAATKQRMFDPFFVAGEPGQGTGLGLSVVHGIAADHGAEILVESELGMGSTFHIYFPAADAGAGWRGDGGVATDTQVVEAERGSVGGDPGAED